MISAPSLCPLLLVPPNCRPRAARSDEPLEVVVAGLRVGDVLVFITEAWFVFFIMGFNNTWSILKVPQKQSREISAPGLCPLLPFPPNCRPRAARSTNTPRATFTCLQLRDGAETIIEASFLKKI